MTLAGLVRRMGEKRLQKSLCQTDEIEDIPSLCSTRKHDDRLKHNVT